MPERTGMARDTDKAVRAACDVVETEQHGIAELRERKRQHGEGHAGRSGADPGDRNRDHVTGKVQKFKMREVAIDELGLAEAAAIATA